MKDYLEFIETKKHSAIDYGLSPVYIPDCLFDYQKYVAEYAIKKGRCAVFLDTGLGKTLVELVVAQNYAQLTNKPVLIVTPLAVAFQFVKEAERFGLESVHHSKDGNYKGKIVVCNYERLDKFSPEDFDCMILDESSILKNFDGKIKAQITNFIKKVKYRYLFTATPSPNDFIELGTSSEALGYMGYMDMLGRFFKNNQNDTGGRHNIGEKFYLKPHAQNDFFAWVNQWAIMVKMPSDIGFSNDKHILPELIINKHVVKNKSLFETDGQICIFTPIARTMTEVRLQQKQTEFDRCEKAIELAFNKTSVYWCNTNNESSILKELDKDAVEIIGSQTIDKKEDILLSFANGDIKRLITKAKMTSMGLNWQHCNHSVLFPTWSYEQYYQAIRRFWRFGQKKDVTIDIVIAEGQNRVLEALQQKTEKSIQLYKNLTENVNKSFENKTKQFNKKMIKPNF